MGISVVAFIFGPECCVVDHSDGVSNVLRWKEADAEAIWVAERFQGRAQFRLGGQTLFGQVKLPFLLHGSLALLTQQQIEHIMCNRAIMHQKLIKLKKKHRQSMAIEPPCNLLACPGSLQCLGRELPAGMVQRFSRRIRILARRSMSCSSRPELH